MGRDEGKGVTGSKWTAAAWVAGACTLVIGCVVLLVYGQAQADRDREARLRAKQRAAAEVYAKRTIPTNPDVDPPYLTLERGTFEDGHRGNVRVTVYGVTLAFADDDDVVFAQRYFSAHAAASYRRVGELAPGEVNFSLAQALADPDHLRQQAAYIDPTEPVYVFLCGQWDVSYEGKLPWRDEAFGVPVEDLPWGTPGPSRCERRNPIDLGIHPGKRGSSDRFRPYPIWVENMSEFRAKIAKGKFHRVPEILSGFQQYVFTSDLDRYRAGERDMKRYYYHAPNDVTGDSVLMGCSHGYGGEKIVACGYYSATHDERVEWRVQLRPNVRGGEPPERWLSTLRATQDVIDNVLVGYGRDDMLREEPQ